MDPQKRAAAPPCTLVLFGADGDLTHRLLMPALYNLALQGLLDPGFKVLGIDRAHEDGASWGAHLSTIMEGFATDHGAEFHPDAIDANAWNFVRERLDYHQADFSDPGMFAALAPAVTGNALFYLAVPSRLFGPLVQGLGGAKLLAEQPGQFRRVMIEKPFGHDLQSARALDAEVRRAAGESQIYRIDHFMGKEMVQSLLAFRAATAMLAPVWNRDAIAQVEITAAETVGVESRGAFYEQTGALRDMVPNHMFTMLAMLAMELPDRMEPETVRDARGAVLAALAPVLPGDCVRGQYASGTVLGQPARDYRAEPGVSPASDTETYVALTLGIDNWRWQGVPFHLRTGKHLAERRTEIVVHFRPPALDLFGGARGPGALTVAVDPEPGITLELGCKLPGIGGGLGVMALRASLPANERGLSLDGYESLFHGAMCGDPTLFQRADSIEAGWAAVQALLDQPPPVCFYASGSAGPEAANALIARSGQCWSPLG